MKPRATYRLQLHEEFTFADAARQVDYLEQLGISHVYSSPILTARKGSRHGYDVIDHSQINPELGGEEALREFADLLCKKGLALIVDIVPNHMAVGKADNPWWLDVLAKGQSSVHAGTFDIDWDQPGLEGKVLAPFLGDAPLDALKKGDLRLVRESGRLAFAYYDHRFPLRPADQSLEDLPDDLAGLETLLGRQNFVLASWREANARINWRRFFDITDLAAIRAGEPQIFEAVHAKIFALYAEGVIDGVRVDHVDGLADPRGYCRTLRARLEALRPGAAIYVEKILADGESLPADWEVDGTTGYDFLNEASAILHQNDGGVLYSLWQQISGRGLNFEEEEVLARGQMLENAFQAQLTATARAFAPLLSMPQSGTSALLTAVLLRLRCYRSYATGRPDSPGAGPFLAAAMDRAKAEIPPLAPQVDAFADLFARRDNDPRVVDALRRFYQLSAPLAAKAAEDTALYRYGRLLSRNDVGTQPTCEYMPRSTFHRRMIRRAEETPFSMLSTATHDHKRGEDSRARLATLSRHPDLWSAFACQASAPTGVDRGDAYQLWQTLFGAWPERVDEKFSVRIKGWCEKFLREAKLRSSWSDPDQAYEKAFCSYANALLLDPTHAPFREGIQELLKALAPDIRAATICQLVLRNTLPGMPDIYQGCEFEDLSLVDPDNRRPVDFDARAAALKDASNEKQQLLTRLLQARRRDPELWARGDYEPLEAGDCLSFRRSHEGKAMQVWIRQGGRPEVSRIEIGRPAVEILTGRTLEPGFAPVEKLFSAYPAAVLVETQYWNS